MGANAMVPLRHRTPTLSIPERGALGIGLERGDSSPVPLPTRGSGEVVVAMPRYNREEDARQLMTARQVGAVGGADGELSSRLPSPPGKSSGLGDARSNPTRGAGGAPETEPRRLQCSFSR